LIIAFNFQQFLMGLCKMSESRINTSTQPSPKKRNVEDSDNSITGIINGLDRSTIAIIGVAGISIGLSFYLYRELRKMKEEIRETKSQEIPDDLIEKINVNSESVETISTKLDQILQIIGNHQQILNAQSNYQQQMQPPQQQQQQQQMQPPQQQQQQIQQQPQVQQPKYEQIQIPMMGGAVIPLGDPDAASGPVINFDSDSDYSGPGLIRI
jgi:DNA segregation ATPase FtsK/SpoIIIE-like protein